MSNISVIQVDEISDAIAQELENYTKEIEDSTRKAIDIVSKKLVENLKSDSPYDKGKYYKGWSIKRYKHYNVIYNRTHGNITAPLEFGHQNRNGTFTSGKPHIKPNERWANEELEDLVINIVSEGLRF